MPCYRGAMVSVSLLALALAGCNKTAQDMSATSSASGLPPLPAALPMQAGPPSQLVVAPPVSALPARRYIGLSRPANERQRYAYLDRASDVQDEIGDAPPDYRYDNDDGVSPWAWQTRGGDYRYAEPTDRGYRDYYYQPGQDSPYLVRTPDYSYAYAGGALVAIYLLNGALVPPDQYGGYRDNASRYFWRGQELRRAAEQRPHEGVIAANWAARQSQFNAQQARWAAARSQQPEWQAYHARNDPSQQPGWQQEHQQRQLVAQQFAGWQSHGLTGTPPPVLAAAGARVMAPASPGFAGPVPLQRHDMPVPHAVAPMAQTPMAVAPMAGSAANSGAQAAAARDRQLAAQREAQRQALAVQQQLRANQQQQILASQRLAQAASSAQQAAAAQRQAAAAQQQHLAARGVAEQQARGLAEQQALARQRAQLAAAREGERAAAQQQANAANAQRLAARQAAQQQALASERAAQAAGRAREEAAARQASAGREQAAAARAAAARQALASQRAEQAAGRAREEAAAGQASAGREQAAAARQALASQRAEQAAANAHRQQAVAAQEQVAAQRRAELARAHAAPGHEAERQQQ